VTACLVLLRSDSPSSTAALLPERALLPATLLACRERERIGERGGEAELHCSDCKGWAGRRQGLSGQETAKIAGILPIFGSDV
jgi:hypothetical protein